MMWCPNYRGAASVSGSSATAIKSETKMVTALARMCQLVLSSESNIDSWCVALSKVTFLGISIAVPVMENRAQYFLLQVGRKSRAVETIYSTSLTSSLLRFF